MQVGPNEGRESLVRTGPVRTRDPNKDPMLVLLQILHLSHVDSCEI